MTMLHDVTDLKKDVEDMRDGRREESEDLASKKST